MWGCGGAFFATASAFPRHATVLGLVAINRVCRELANWPGPSLQCRRVGEFRRRDSRGYDSLRYAWPACKQMPVRDELPQGLYHRAARSAYCRCPRIGILCNLPNILLGAHRWQAVSDGNVTRKHVELVIVDDPSDGHVDLHSWTRPLEPLTTVYKSDARYANDLRTSGHVNVRCIVLFLWHVPGSAWNDEQCFITQRDPRVTQPPLHGVLSGTTRCRAASRVP